MIRKASLASPLHVSSRAHRHRTPTPQTNFSNCLRKWHQTNATNPIVKPSRCALQVQPQWQIISKILPRWVITSSFCKVERVRLICGLESADIVAFSTFENFGDCLLMAFVKDTSLTAFFQRISMWQNQVRGQPQGDDRIREILEAGKKRSKSVSLWASGRWLRGGNMRIYITHRQLNTSFCACIYMRANTGRILVRSAAFKRNLKGMGCRHVVRRQLQRTRKTILGKMGDILERHWLSPGDGLTSLGDAYKDITSLHLWRLYIFPKTRKMPKDGPRYRCFPDVWCASSLLLSLLLEIRLRNSEPLLALCFELSWSPRDAPLIYSCTIATDWTRAQGFGPGFNLVIKTDISELEGFWARVIVEDEREVLESCEIREWRLLSGYEELAVVGERSRAVEVGERKGRAGCNIAQGREAAADDNNNNNR